MKNHIRAKVTVSVAFAAFLMAQSAIAATQTWTNAPADQNLATSANWISTVAPVNGDTVVFNDSAITNLNNNLPDAQGLVFNFNLTTNSTYTITNTGVSITLSNNITDNSVTPVTFIGGAFWMPAARTFSVVPGGNLVIGSVISNSTGNNALTISQSLFSPNTQQPTVPVLINYGASATLTLNAAMANAFTNTTTLNAGTALALDFSNMGTPVNLLSTNSVVMNGAIYNLKGKATGTTVQTNLGTLTYANGNVISINNNGGSGTALTLGNTWTRSGTGTLMLDLSSGGTVFANPALANGIIGGSVAVKDATAVGFATTNASGMVVRNNTTTTLPTSGTSPTVNYITSGNVTMNSGSFGVNSLVLNASSGSGVLDLGGAADVMTNTSRGILMTGGNNYTIQNGNIATNNGEIIIQQMGTGALNLNATIGSGSASITKSGTGTLVINSLSTNTGTAVINLGTVKLGVSSTSTSGPLGTPTSGLNINAGGVLDLNGNNLTVGAYSVNSGGAVVVTNSAVGVPAVITMGNGNANYSGYVDTCFSGNLTVVLTGTYGGTALRMYGYTANAHTGGTILTNNSASSNPLRFYNSSALGYGPLVFGGNGSLTVPSSSTAGWNLGVSNPVVVNNIGNTFSWQPNTTLQHLMWFTGPWTGTGTLTIQNAYSDQMLWGGDMSGFQGTLVLQGNTGTTPSHTFGYVNTNNEANIGGAYQGTFDLQSVTTGNLNLQYNNTNTPSTVRLGDLNTAGNTGTGAITLQDAAANTAVTFEVGALNNSSTFSGNIINNASGSTVGITKIGTGTWTLTGGTLSYTGNTTISNGILAVNSSISSSPVSVFGPGGLAGSGSVGGLVTLNAGNAGILLTNGVGAMLSLTGGLTLSNANVLAFDIGPSTATSDQIAVNGTFTQAGTATIYIAPISGFAAGTFTLISGASGISASNFTMGTSLPGYTLSLSNDSSDLYLTVTVSAPPTAFWDNHVSTVWNAHNGSIYNWDTDASSGINVSNVPATPTDVTFAAAGANNFNTTLGANFAIHSLTLSTPNNVTINGANTLTIGTGINNSGASNVINANVVLGIDQAWVNNSSYPLTVNSNISGIHALTINDNGNGVVLNGVNTYSGGTYLESGLLVLANPTNTLADTGYVYVDNNSTLSLGTNNDTVGAVAVNYGNITGAGGKLTASSFALTNAIVTANLAGSGSPLIQDNGTATLSGTNSYTGTTTVGPGGTLVLSGNNSAVTGSTVVNGTLELLSSPTAISSASVLTVASGLTIELVADQSTAFTCGGINAGTVLYFTANEATGAGVNGSTLALNGPITWTASGTTLQVDGANNYAVALGDLFGGNGAGATLNADSANLTIHSFTGLGNSSSINFAGPNNISVTAGITNSPTKGLALNFNQTGTVTLWGADSLSGTGPVSGTAFAVNSGTVVLNNATPISSLRGNPTLGLITGSGADTGAQLLLGGTDVNGLTGGITMNKNVIVEDGTTNGGSMNVGPMILGGQNTSGINYFTGSVTLGYDLNIGMSATLESASGGEVDFTGNILANGTDTTAGLTVGDAVHGGTVKLLGTNTYAGPTLLTNGTLVISTLHAGGGAFSVADSATLGTTNAQNSAGAALGSLTFGTRGSTTVRFDNVVSTTIPLINAAGAVTVNGSSTIVITTNNAITTAGEYPLIKYGSLSGSFALAATPTNFVATLINDTSQGWIALNVSSVYQPINPLPGPIQFGVSGSTLSLSWPTNAGWILQSQTNSVAAGLGTNWVDVSGSSSVTATNITIVPTNATVFYRLRRPF